jgi:hypothetical protein
MIKYALLSVYNAWVYLTEMVFANKVKKRYYLNFHELKTNNLKNKYIIISLLGYQIRVGEIRQPKDA